MTELCPKCGTPLEPPGTPGGRPRRWCSPGCQRSGEAQMRRINLVLKRMELDKARQQRYGPGSHRDAAILQLDAVIAEWQKAYDRLAGVPERGSDD
jgi:hypothetical protein